MKKLLWGIIACLVLVAVPMTVPKPAHACMCFHTPHTVTREEAEQHDAIFVGRVVSIEAIPDNDDSMNKAVRFEMISAWKGVSQRQVTIYTGSSMCDIQFRGYKQWLVYADEWDGKPLRAGWCTTNTAPLASEEAQEDLRVLGRPEYVSNNTSNGRSNSYAINLASFGSMFSFLVVFLFSLQFLLPVVGLFR